MDDEIDLARALLDHQLVDCEGRRCGKVDDIELEGRPGERLRVAALISGPGAWPRRLPRPVRATLGRLLTRLFGSGETRIAWRRVRDIGAVVELDTRAPELGLGRGDDLAAPVFTRIPGG